MKKRIVLLLIITTLLASCAPVVTATPAAPTAALEPLPLTSDSGACPSVTAPQASPAIYGLWVKDLPDSQRDLLTITEKAFYLVEFDATGEGMVRESYYSISSVDWVNGVMQMRLEWVRVNGRYGGFDSPSKQARVSVDGDTLYFSIADVGLELPAAADGPWNRN
jgi:hypothetical protein